MTTMTLCRGVALLDVIVWLYYYPILYNCSDHHTVSMVTMTASLSSPGTPHERVVLHTSSCVIVYVLPVLSMRWRDWRPD